MQKRVGSIFSGRRETRQAAWASRGSTASWLFAATAGLGTVSSALRSFWEADILKKDPVQNIRGAAAYLRSLYDAQPVPEGTVRGSLESWQNAIALYCGIPQPELAQQHALEMLSLGPIQLAKGAVTGGPAAGDIVPTSFLLSQNFPNPFNPVTVISYQLSALSKVQLRVFDVLGREVAVLVNEEKEAGSYRATWDASSMPSGVYFYTLATREYRASKKMVLVK